MTSTHSLDKTVHLADIAKKTGYSLATVSKVLNNRSDVSSKAKEIINTALQESGYERRPRTVKQRKLIEVVFQNFDSLWCLEVLRGALAAANERGLSIIVTESGDREHPGADWLSDMLQRAPYGVVLVFSDLTDNERELLRKHGIPAIILDPSGDPSSGNMSVQADNWSGGLLATRHLIQLGHTRIGIITGPMAMICSRARLDGYSTALAESGLTYDPDLVREGDFHTEGGLQQGLSLLKDPDKRPTAIFGGCDIQCMGIYEAARNLGLRIPEDLSVVGFDNIQTSQFMSPPLTTVMQPLQEMAAAAVQMIADQQNGRIIRKRETLPTTLIVRESTQQIHNS